MYSQSTSQSREEERAPPGTLPLLMVGVAPLLGILVYTVTGILDPDAIPAVLFGYTLIAIILIILATVRAYHLAGVEHGEAPQVSFDYETTDRGYIVIHAGGDSFDPANLQVVNETSFEAGINGVVDAGDTTDNTVAPGSKIVFDDPESDSSAVIGEVPE